MLAEPRVRFLAGRSHEIGGQDLLEGRMRDALALDELVELLRRSCRPAWPHTGAPRRAWPCSPFAPGPRSSGSSCTVSGLPSVNAFRAAQTPPVIMPRLFGRRDRLCAGALDGADIRLPHEGGIDLPGDIGRRHIRRREVDEGEVGRFQAGLLERAQQMVVAGRSRGDANALALEVGQLLDARQQDWPPAARWSRRSAP